MMVLLGDATTTDEGPWRGNRDHRSGEGRVSQQFFGGDEMESSVLLGDDDCIREPHPDMFCSRTVDSV